MAETTALGNPKQDSLEQISARKKTRRRPRLISKILWLEVPWIILLGPSLLLTEYFWEPQYRLIFVGYLFLFWPVRLIVQRLRLMPGPSSWPLYLMMVGIALGIVAAEGVDRAWEGAAYILYGIAAMVALVNWHPVRRQPRLLLLVLAAIGIPLALLGPELFSVNPRKLLDVYEAGRVTTPATTLWEERINPNIMAGALVPLIPLFAALALWSSWRRRPWLPLLSIVLTVLMGNALILSQSRGGYIAVAGGLSLMLLLRWPRLLYGLPVLLVGGVIALLTATIDATTVGPLIRQAFVSLEDRILIWQIGLDMFQNSPLTGIGIGQFDLSLTNHYAAYLPYFFNSPPPHAHNLLIQIGLDSGLLGLCGSVILFGWLSYQLIRRLILSRAAPGWPESVGALSGFFALFLFGIFDVANWGTKLTFVPWVLIAFVVLWVNYDFDSMD